MYRGFSMGPRGRMFGHRGFRPGIFAGIIGLIFFGWIIVAIVGALLGCGLMFLSAIAHALAHIAPRLFAGLLSSRSVIAGLIIGLVWYFRTHRRNAPRHETVRESGSSADGAAAETEIVETQNYRTFNA